MTTSSRRTFYPLPPSLYPRPLLDPAPAYETSYGKEFGATKPSEELFFRSRTYNDMTPVDPAMKPNARRDIYPKHGEGGYNLPYYRRDSKGFRVPYTQPTYVDDYYLRKTAHTKEASLTRSLNQWAHPSSVPNYRDGPLVRTGRSRPQTSTTFEEYYGSSPTAAQTQQIDQDTQRRQIMAEEERRQRNAILNDPLLVDPLSNAFRKSRTVYKRSFGSCR